MNRFSDEAERKEVGGFGLTERKAAGTVTLFPVRPQSSRPGPSRWTTCRRLGADAAYYLYCWPAEGPKGRRGLLGALGNKTLTMLMRAAWAGRARATPKGRGRVGAA